MLSPACVGARLVGDTGGAGRLGLGRGGRYSSHVVAGLAYLHRHCVIHGNLKPSNILVRVRHYTRACPSNILCLFHILCVFAHGGACPSYYWCVSVKYLLVNVHPIYLRVAGERASGVGVGGIFFGGGLSGERASERERAGMVGPVKVDDRGKDSEKPEGSKQRKGGGRRVEGGGGTMTEAGWVGLQGREGRERLTNCDLDGDSDRDSDVPLMARWRPGAS